MTARDSVVGVAQQHQPQGGWARGLWQGWKRVARKIGDFQARVLMSVFYFVILGPMAMALRTFSDPLAMKPRTRRGWGNREAREGTPLENARRQS